MNTASGSRARLVTNQNGREHVSSVVLGIDEVADHLHAEAVLHQAFGWAVYEQPGELVVAQRPGIRREVYARYYDAASDVLTPREVALSEVERGN